MTLEPLLDELDVVSGLPGAPAKLRALVLKLGVQGNLTRQDDRDEPASALLERLDRGLSPDQRRRRSAPIPPLSHDDVPFETPKGWLWARFRDAAIIASDLVDPKDFQSLPHLAPDNVEKGTGRLLPCRTVREDSVTSWNHRFRPGQIVYSKIRPNLSKVVLVDFAGLCSADMYPIDSLIEPQFLQRYMLSEWFLVQAVKSDSRVAMPKINQAELNAIAVPVPPLAEQTRIVAKVDELMALCDRLEAQQRERETRHAALASASVERVSENPTPANLDFLFHRSYDLEPRELRKVVLALAIRGKLEPQRRDDEPVDDLLGRVQRKRRALVAEKRASDGGELPPVGVEEQAFEVPNTWRWIRFGAVSVCRDGQRIPVSKDERAGRRGPYDYYGASGVIDKIDGFLFDEPLLLIGEDGANLLNRSTPIAFLAYGKYWVNNHAHVLDSDSVDVLRYLALVFNAIDLAPYVTGTAQPKMNQAKMNSIPIPVPPVEEQRRIVEKVDRLMDLVNKLEESLGVSRVAGEKLLDAVVAELTESARAA